MTCEGVKLNKSLINHTETKLLKAIYKKMQNHFFSSDSSRHLCKEFQKAIKAGPITIWPSPGHDNAPAQSVVAMAAVRDCGFELVDHPPYLLIWHHLFSVPKHKKDDCPGETGPPSSVFHAVHKMSLALLCKVLNYLSSVGFSWKKQYS